MNDATASRTALVLLFALAAGCAPKGPQGPSVTVPRVGPVSAPAGAEGQPTLAPPTPEEQQTAAGLKETVSHLATEIGERNPERSWNLASATDDLARTLEKMGYSVRRKGIVMGDDVVMNLDIVAGGGAKGNEVIVVGAHYDSATGSPGANDDASGAAAVIELARHFRDRKTSRQLRFALFANGEGVHAGTERGGSLVFGKELAQGSGRVVGVVSLDGLGVYGAARPREHDPALPDRSDYVALVAVESSRPFLELVATAMKGNTTADVQSAVVAPDAKVLAESDALVFGKLGIPAVSLTDTGALRDPNRHGKGDVPAALDFDRLARVVVGLEKSLEALTASE